MTTNADISFDQLIARFNLYRNVHPNIVACWISYLGLKKRHYELDSSLLGHCEHVLHHLSAGHEDIDRDDLLRLTLYKMSQ